MILYFFQRFSFGFWYEAPGEHRLKESPAGQKGESGQSTDEMECQWKHEYYQSAGHPLRYDRNNHSPATSSVGKYFGYQGPENRTDAGCKKSDERGHQALGKGMGISIADFNGDGLMDIFVANDTEPNFLFINQGNGTLSERGLEYGVAYNAHGDSVSGMGSDAKDFDNDGWVDIIYNALAGQVYGLLKNEGGKSFDDITWTSQLGHLSRNLSGWSIGFIDFDNDGLKDIYSANGDVDNLTLTSRQHDTMFRNVDGKTLEDVTD